LLYFVAIIISEKITFIHGCKLSTTTIDEIKADSNERYEIM